jgi:hypothetical protein
MEKLVEQAIIKIATMWNPAGAIIQLIQTAWNVYCWVKENAQRIFGLVQAVVDSISNIPNGNIAGAANYIENSLAKLVPIAISLFANLLGLGGIADKIKSIIEKIQTKVDQAIDKLIDRVIKEAPLEAKQRELADFLPRPKRLRSREGYAREDFRSRQQDRAHARIDDGGVRLLLGSDVDRRRQRRNARPRPHRGEEASQRRA